MQIHCYSHRPPCWSLNTSHIFLPQSLYTCSTFCLKHSSPKNRQGLLPPFLQVSSHSTLPMRLPLSTLHKISVLSVLLPQHLPVILHILCVYFQSPPSRLQVPWSGTAGQGEIPDSNLVLTPKPDDEVIATWDKGNEISLHSPQRQIHSIMEKLQGG